jgi:YD repeat-containing protein
MPKLFFTALIALVLISLLGGCKKEPIEALANVPGPYVRTVTNIHLQDTAVYTLTYDDKHRLIAFMAPDSTGVTYTYGVGTVMETHNDSARFAAIAHLLDADGYVKASTDTRKFVYQDGRCISEEDKLQGLKNMYNWEHQNQMSAIIVSSTGTRTITYNYYMDKVNTIGNHNAGMQWRGKQSFNLLSSEASYNNGAISTIYYTYDFDSLGRVSRQHLTGAVEKQVEFTYY